MALWDGVLGSWPLDEASGTRHDLSPNALHLLEVGGSVPAIEDAVFGGNCVRWTADSAAAKLQALTDLIDTSNGYTMAFWHKGYCPQGWGSSSTGTSFRNDTYFDLHDAGYDNYGEIWNMFEANRRLPSLISSYQSISCTTGEDQYDTALFSEIGNRWSLYVLRSVNPTGLQATINALPSGGEFDDYGPVVYPPTAFGLVSIYSEFPALGTYPNYLESRVCGATIWNRVISAQEEREYYNRGAGLKYGESGDSSEIVLPVPYVCWDCDEKVNGEYYEDYITPRNRLTDDTAEYYIDPDPTDVTPRLLEHDEDGLLGGCARGDMNTCPLMSEASPTKTTMASRTLASGIYIPAYTSGVTLSFWVRYKDGFPVNPVFPYAVTPQDSGLYVFIGDLGERFEGSLGIFRGGPNVFPVPGGPLYSTAYVTPEISFYKDFSHKFNVKINGEANNLTPDHWMHLVVRVGETLSAVFVDGVKLAETMPTPTTNLFFCRTDMYDGFYNISAVFASTTADQIEFEDYIKFCNFSVWPGDLTDEDILEIYNGGIGVACLTEPPPPPVEFSEQFIIHTSLLGSYIGVTADGCVAAPVGCKPISELFMSDIPISVLGQGVIPESSIEMASTPLSIIRCLIRK